MARWLGIILVSCVAGGFAGLVAHRAGDRGVTEPPPVPPAPAPPVVVATPPPNDRVAETRSADPAWQREIVARLDREAAERFRLEQEVANLRDRLADLDRLVARAESRREPWEEPEEKVDAPLAEEPHDPKIPLEQRLAELGMAEGRAAEIAQRINARELDILYLRDQATREGWLNTPRFAEAMRDMGGDPRVLREELGDADYDRFLFATGQPNRVVLDAVIPGSVAEEAGLQGGDTIIQYDDQRVFSGAELQAATVTGQAGLPVAITVVRGGERVQRYVPRGPLGIRFHVASQRPAGEP